MGLFKKNITKLRLNNDISGLLKVLEKEKNESVLIDAIITIGILGDPSTIHNVSKYLDNKSPLLRYAAALSLGKLGNNDAVQYLLKILDNNDNIFRSCAILSLGNIKDQTAIETLINLLKDKELRSYAALSIGKIGRINTIEILIKELKTKDETYRQCLELSLSYFGEPAVEPLIHSLNNKNENVRCSSVSVLGYIGDPKAVNRLINVLEGKSKYMRWLAAEALGNIGDPRAVNPLINALTSRDEDFNNFVESALAKFGKSAVDDLIHALKNKNKNIRRCAAYALGIINDVKAKDPLLEAINDKNDDVRYAIAEALGKLGVTEGKNYIIKTLNDLYNQYCYKSFKSYLSNDIDILISSLGRIGDAQASEMLKYFLKSKFKNSAAYALYKSGDLNAIQTFTVRIYQRSPAADRDISWLSMLGEESDKRVAKYLIVKHLLKSLQYGYGPNTEFINSEALKALSRLHPNMSDHSMVVKLLLKSLKHYDYSVREGAATALINVGNTDAAIPLIRVLEDEKYSVRSAAVKALGKILFGFYEFR